MRVRHPLVRAARAIGALLFAAWAGGALAQDPPAALATPPIDSACPAGNLVDPAFRDAAVLTMRRLVVRAPGRATHGAVRRSLGAAHVDRRGRTWHHVAAYEANLGFVGALRVDATMRREAADWLRWQAAQLPLSGPDRGVLHDRWVLADGSQQSACPADIDARHCRQIDAVDSTLASFFLMAQAYLRHGGDAALLREPALRAAFDVAAATLATLQQTEGLSWAKADHPVAYLMDAVEVAAGWRALAQLQAEAWGDAAGAAVSRHQAQRTQDALQRSLWDGSAGLWRVSLNGPATRLARWYPDSMAQAWPLLWGPAGRDPAQVTRDRAAWQRAAAAWHTPERHWAARNVDPAGFWWPAAAVAAHCSGDAGAAADWVARARRAWLAGPPPFPWPFQVSDLLWLLWLAEPGPPQAPLPDPAPAPPALSTPLSVSTPDR
ncbi:hypothetical protein [Sphaerotilus microaerophilus]|uniref:Uncharacterized protein n=1 Tax=Sphaerotilus microaerophilus TaxID=2914710 RepID=A0ABN6PQH2_9BURK|nr:hypothetical protein [Sphaerotilus sp. FB-5]BDI07419.1 hypothetical protein CATMQ487_43890 [Sphaerotilus sp. FB-5]